MQWDSIGVDKQIWLISQLVIALFLIMMVFYFLGQAIKVKEVASQRHFYLGLSAFVAFNSVTQVLWNIDKWTAELTTVPVPSDGSFVVDFTLPFIGGGAFIPYLFVLFLWSFTAICWPVEKYVTNSKRFPITTINLVGTIAMSAYIFIVPWFFPGINGADPMWEESWQILEYMMYGIVGIGAIGFILSLILIIGFYMVLGCKTGGSVRKKSLLIAFGFILVFVGLILTQLKDDVGAWVALISPTVMIVGFVFLASGYRIQI